MFDASDVHALASDLNAANSRLESRARSVVGNSSADVERSAKIRSPYRTGNLMNSIGRDLEGLSAVIGPTAHYGVYLEYGTSRMRARPYMGPALDAVTPSFVKAVEELGADLL